MRCIRRLRRKCKRIKKEQTRNLDEIAGLPIFFWGCLWYTVPPERKERQYGRTHRTAAVCAALHLAGYCVFMRVSGTFALEKKVYDRPCRAAELYDVWAICICRRNQDTRLPAVSCCSGRCSSVSARRQARPGCCSTPAGRRWAWMRCSRIFRCSRSQTCCSVI